MAFGQIRSEKGGREEVWLHRIDLVDLLIGFLCNSFWIVSILPGYKSI